VTNKDASSSAVLLISGHAGRVSRACGTVVDAESAFARHEVHSELVSEHRFKPISTTEQSNTPLMAFSDAV
jgi:hypothetical protein